MRSGARYRGIPHTTTPGTAEPTDAGGCLSRPAGLFWLLGTPGGGPPSVLAGRGRGDRLARAIAQGQAPAVVAGAGSRTNVDDHVIP